MPTILDEIISYKHTVVAEAKSLYPVKLLEKSIYFSAPVVSFKKYITRPDKLGIVAEIKRKSPSKGMINEFVDFEAVSIGYMQAGASAISVLTDSQYFGGKNEDLTKVRQFNYCPILRKDFIIDEYQIIEARSIGADVILLIAAALSPSETLSLAKFAKSLNLEVLLEVHNREELDGHVNPYIDVVGVNNRNLKDFTLDVQLSYNLLPHMPKGIVKISESGISDPQTLVDLRTAGYDGFLMGENFMKHSRPQEACTRFVKQVQAILAENKIPLYA